MNDFLNMVGGFFADCLSMALVMIAVENMVFSRALGTSTALVIIRKRNSLPLFGAILTVITVLAGIATYLLEPLVKGITNVVYYRPLIYVAVIGAIYLVVLVVCGYLPEQTKDKVKPMVHISAFNCVVLGTLLLVAGEQMTFGSSIGFGLGVGVGFTLATFFISVAYDYLYSAAIPKAFRGFPVLLIYIGLLSLAFYGLVGHQLPF